MGKFVDFYVKMMETPEAQKKFGEIMANGSNEKALDELIALAKEYGFDFTKEEVIEYYKANVGNDSAELTDADLEAVAGGKGFKIPSYSNEDFGKALLGLAGNFI